ncbi:MAG TPA: FAD-dependent oxidoreductase [Candidatus Acidoferrales bacterium]|nr:FAD-dependent oxidoreductase [Candidatus Acidoferrales bacterium]
MFTRSELRAIPLFATLTDDALDFVIGHSADIRLLPGEYVSHEGDTTRALFVLVEGALDVLKVVENEERTISTRAPGDSFGELPLVLNTPLAVSFRASKPARVLRLDGKEFKGLPESARGLATAIEASARERIEGLQEVATSPAPPMLTVIGPQWDDATYELREFLDRNAIDFDWITPDGTGKDYPQVRLRDGTVLKNPSTRRLAEALGLNCSPQKSSYDVVIIGGGPAGLAAAVYGASEGLATLLVECEAPGGQAGTSSRIENYLGFPYGVSGGELAHRAFEQAKRLGAEIVVTRSAMRIDPASYTVTLDDEQTIGAHTIVLATGVSWRRLGIPSVDRLRGRGVYYGAAPDEVRSVFGKDVFIVGAGNSAGQAAVNLANRARAVTVLVRGDSLEKSMSRYLIDQLAAKPNVTVQTKTEVVDVHGETHLEAITTTNGGPIPASALFIMIGADAETQWLPHEICRDAQGYVLTGPNAPHMERQRFFLETCVPGIFAVGDVRSGSIKRVAAAVGEGSMAIALIHQYLAQLPITASRADAAAPPAAARS